MSGKANKFGFLKSARQNEEQEPAAEAPLPAAPAPEEVASPSPALPAIEAAEPASKPKAKPTARTVEPPRPVGRPRGKRSDDDHVQVTAYIRRDTHLDVKAALLRDQKGRDFSELTEELLAKWLKSRT